MIYHLNNELAKPFRGVIEDKLSITNEDSEQNMQTVLDQIKFIDTEVRKLWGHRKGYLDSIKKQENKTAANDRSIKQLGSKSTNLEDKIDSINNKIELAEDLQLKITMLTNELNKQKQILDDNGENLDAIDRYRIQNNQKVTEILTRLNNLSRELDDIQESLNMQTGATNG
jgi:chromosome segregation ATPase